MSRFSLVVLFISFFYNLGFGQSNHNEIDSFKLLIQQTNSDTAKINYYHDLVSVAMFANPNKAIKFGHKNLTLSKKIQYKVGYAYELLFLVHNHSNTHTDSLAKYVELLAQEYSQSGDSRKELVSHWSYAFYYEKLNLRDKEIEAYLKALEVVKNSDDEDLKGNESPLLNNIASLFNNTGKPKKALEYYQKALALVVDEYSKANILFNIASMYKNFENMDSCQIFLDEAYQLFQKINDLEGVAYVLIERAKISDDKRQYERANQLYFDALKIIEDNELGDFVLIYDALATHYLKTKQFSNSIEYAEKALQNAVSNENSEYLENLYLTLDSSYVAVGNYKKAHAIRGLFIENIDSTNNASLLGRINELQIEFGVEQKEAENRLLKTNLRARQYISIALIIALLFAIALAILTYKSSQQRKRYNEILEQKVAERTKELEQANYELRTFNYIASHDIKEPIRNISSYVGLIRRKLPTDLKASLSDYFDTIKRSSSQLYTLIEDFAYYTKMSKDDTIKKEIVHLSQLSNAVIDNLEESIQKYNGEVIVLELPSIQSSHSLLFVIFKNLIENGLKYNHSQMPTIKIAYQATATFHQLSVSDNGIGIEKEYHEKIFESFKRLHNRADYEGSGIGLSIVKLLVEKLNGHITVNSEVNQGSIFVINLPK